MKLFGSLKELVSVVFRKDGKEVTLEAGTQAGTATSRVFTLPDINSDSPVAHELLTENAVQNVTNKTIDADSNTITNIENDNIKDGAAINAAKIGSGAVSNTEFGYLDGVSSAIQTQIDGKQATITGAATTITSSDLTASKALQSDASGKVSASSVTSTELGYVSGVTSAIQTQINSKQATITGAASTIVSSDLSVSKALQSDASGKVSASSVTSTELGYVSGVTSAIQTQLGNKAANGANSDITSLSGLTTALSIGQGGTGQTTANTALNALLPSQASAANKYLKSDGTNTSWASASGGAGELNAILNASGADGTTGWTNVSVVSGASSPLNPVVTTAFSISNAATTESSTSGGYYPFTMPSGMLNRKLKVEFTYTTPATDVYKVSVYKGSTRVALSTDVSGSTSLPASVTGGKFVAYFDTDSSTSWTLSVTRTSGSTGACVVTNVIVGPGIQPQGAVVGEWTSYTPTWAGFGSKVIGTNRGYYRRIGSNLELMFAVSGNNVASGGGASEITLSLPPGLTTNTSVTGAGDAGNFGAVQTWGITSSGVYDYTTQAINGATPGLVRFTKPGTNAFYTTADLNVARAIQFEGVLSIPIAEWAGSGTVQLAQNDVELSFNSSTTDADDTTSFGYGPSGNTVPNISGATNRVKRVRFQTPIQTTDIITIEVKPGSSGEFSTFLAAPSGTTTGISWAKVNATDIDVTFGFSGNNANTAFGTATWATRNSSNWTWRVRKSSAGAAVGFGIVQPGVSSGLVSASGVPGNTTGSAIAAGYVGEEILSVQANANWTAGSTNYGDVTTITLTAGVWKINGCIGILRNSVTFSAIELRGYYTSTAGNSVTGVVNNVTAIYGDAAYPTTFTFIPLVMPEITVISNGTNLVIKDGSNTTYTSTQILRLKLDIGFYASGTPQVGGFLRAIRIA